MLHNYLMYGIGGLIVGIIILVEQYLIEMFSGPLVILLEKIKKEVV